MKLHQAIWGIIIVALICISPTQGADRNSRTIEKFVLAEGKQWSFHYSRDGRVRAIYGSDKGRLVQSVDSEKLFLSDYAEMFGIENPSSILPANVEQDAHGTDFYFRQLVAGIPVVGGKWAVHTDQAGHVVASGGRYFNMAELRQGEIVPSENGRRTAARFRFADGLSKGTLMILAGIGTPRVVWKYSVFSNRTPGQWAIYVDAQVPQKVLWIHREFAEESATGNVFLENPTVTPNQSAEQFLYLLDAGTLKGKYTKTYNANFQLPPPRNGDLSSYTTAAETDKDYTFPITDARFAEAMAYYHINVVHDRWRSFGFKKLNRQLPVFVNVVTATGKGFDNAFYTRGGSDALRKGAIVMGAGDFFQNFGHDADVYYHEYGHAVLDRAKPGFFQALESNYPWAFHEGFSDISSSAITGNSKLAEFALSSRSTGKFFGRNLENRNSFPKNVILKGLGKSEPHHTGLIVGGTWWDLQKQIGIQKAQEILYRSLALLPNDMNFFDLRDAMLTADLRANAGTNATVINQAFSEHGLSGVDPGQTGAIQIRKLRTARINFSNFRLSLRKNFKRGDYIVVLADYSGSKLTPGYNLIPVEFQVNSPINSTVDAFPFIDELANGLHRRKQGHGSEKLEHQTLCPANIRLHFARALAALSR